MSEENVVKTTDVEPKRLPKSFRDLKKDELVAAANYFGSETEGNVEVLRADLEENGVTWEMYVKAFLAPKDDEEVVEEEKFEMPTSVTEWDEENVDGGEEVSEVLTVEPAPQLKAAEKYLIKFIGDNPYFEFGKYRFSQERPYGIMPAEDAQKALVNEPTKFRQAFPAELQEFYG